MCPLFMFLQIMRFVRTWCIPTADLEALIPMLAFCILSTSCFLLWFLRRASSVIMKVAPPVLRNIIVLAVVLVADCLLRPARASRAGTWICRHTWRPT